MQSQLDTQRSKHHMITHTETP